MNAIGLTTNTAVNKKEESFYHKKRLSKIHHKTKTPHFAILIITLIALGFVLYGDFSVIARLTTVSIFAAHVFVNSAMIRLRFKLPDEERQFKVPLNIGKFPVIAGLGLVSGIVMLIFSDPVILGLEAILILIGVAVYRIGARSSLPG